MANAGAPRDLEVDQDPLFERRDWTVQRAAWVLLSLLLVAGLAGLFGKGWLSEATAGERGGMLWIEYERFGRWHASEELRVHLQSAHAKDGVVALSLSRDFVDMHKIQRITPEPAAVEAQGDRVAFLFHARAPDREVAVTFELKPERWGRKTNTVTTDGYSVSFTQLVYP